jgi:hypothetical protein
LLNVATPLTAAAAAVPTVPPFAPLTDAVTVSVESDTKLPPESKMFTLGWVVNAAPDAVPSAAVAKRISAGAPVVTEMEWLSDCSAVPLTLAEYVRV